MEDNHSCTPEIIAWLDKANDAFYRGRIYSILDEVGHADNEKLIMQWNALMEEMYGDTKSLKQAVIEAGMTDPKVSVAARKWLKDTTS